MTNHVLVDKEGSPLAMTTTAANGDERGQVVPLLEKTKGYLKKLSKKGKTAIVEMDKGYDSLAVRIGVVTLGIFPWIPYRNNRVVEKGTIYLEKERWMVERAIAWLQKKFRRIVCRWERKPVYWRGFLQTALIVFWATKLARHIG
jgi:transposase